LERSRVSSEWSACEGTAASSGGKRARGARLPARAIAKAVVPDNGVYFHE
jgi:hypothetical protein